MRKRIHCRLVLIISLIVLLGLSGCTSGGGGGGMDIIGLLNNPLIQILLLVAIVIWLMKRHK